MLKVKVILYNSGANDYSYKHGDRIAQMLLLPCTQHDIVEVDSWTTTKRGSNGWGSTGTNAIQNVPQAPKDLSLGRILFVSTLCILTYKITSYLIGLC